MVYVQIQSRLSWPINLSCRRTVFNGYFILWRGANKYAMLSSYNSVDVRFLELQLLQISIDFGVKSYNK